MIKKSIIFVLVFFCIRSMSLCQDVSFRIPLSIQHPDSAKPITLIFGVDPQATYCVDTTLGEGRYFSSAECWTSLYYGLFQDPHGYSDCFGVGLNMDIRRYESSTQIDTYQIAWCTYFPVILRWPPNLNQYYDSAVIMDLMNGAIYSANMLTTDSLIVSAINQLRLIMVGPKSPTGVSLREAKLPETQELKQNYPNPFNPSTRIQYSVSRSQYVSLKIFDVLGREIATLVNETQPPGNYEIKWNAESIPNGIYYYHLSIGDFLKTKKMILLK